MVDFQGLDSEGNVEGCKENTKEKMLNKIHVVLDIQPDQGQCSTLPVVTEITHPTPTSSASHPTHTTAVHPPHTTFDRPPIAVPTRIASEVVPSESTLVQQAEEIRQQAEEIRFVPAEWPLLIQQTVESILKTLDETQGPISDERQMPVGAGNGSKINIGGHHVDYVRFIQVIGEIMLVVMHAIFRDGGDITDDLLEKVARALQQRYDSNLRNVVTETIMIEDKTSPQDAVIMSEVASRDDSTEFCEVAKNCPKTEVCKTSTYKFVSAVYKYVSSIMGPPKEEKDKEAAVKSWYMLAIGCLFFALTAVLAFVNWKFMSEKSDKAMATVSSSILVILVILQFNFSLVLVFATQISPCSDRLIKMANIVRVLLLLLLALIVVVLAWIIGVLPHFLSTLVATFVTLAIVSCITLR